MFSYGPPHMAEQKQDDQLEPTYSSSVRIRDVALRTCQKWLTIGRSGERGWGISVLAARHDDDDDDEFVSKEHKQIDRGINFLELKICCGLSFKKFGSKIWNALIKFPKKKLVYVLCDQDSFLKYHSRISLIDSTFQSLNCSSRRS